MMLARAVYGRREGTPTPFRGSAAALLAAVMLACLLSGFTALLALAQDGTPVQRTYINPFPAGDRYRIAVFGDSLADGLWGGLYRAFEGDGTLEFIKRSQLSSGFARPDRYDWNAEIDKILKDETYQIAVVMFGASDAQTIRDGGQLHQFGTEAWREAYGKRVEQFIKKLRDANIAVYWVGLPVMRSPSQSEAAEKMNDVYREKAFINGAKYVDTWSGFTDEAGRYSAYGPDMTGQVKRLRADDGFHFTMRGYVKLAHFVEKELRKDLNVAKQERNIPLAGGEEEQAKVMGRFVAPETEETPEKPAPQPQPEKPVAAAEDETEEIDTYTGTSEGGEAGQSKVGGVNVVRPAIPTAEQGADILGSGPEVSSSEPEVITSEIPGGLTAVATISAVTDLSLTSSRPRLPLTQRPYYKVLIKGEQLEPKSGRADDFTWPPG